MVSSRRGEGKQGAISLWCSLLCIIRVEAGPPVDQKVVGSISLRILIPCTKGTAGQCHLVKFPVTNLDPFPLFGLVEPMKEKTR